MSRADAPANDGLLPAWLSPGAAVIASLGVLACVGLAFAPSTASEGRVMWTFARPHYLMYESRVEAWNKTQAPKVDLKLISLPAMERRMMSAFLGGVPSADLIEIERRAVSRSFAGPVESVGFYDLTDRLKQEGLLDAINSPSFSPWTSRGRVFGLPHDVHPVMLGYRADLVEAAGIDVSKIETWDDFARAFSKLQVDANNDGEPDRFALNMWETHNDHLELLLAQAGGGFFDESNRLTVDSDINAHVLATIVTWIAGPNRIAADAPNFSAAGNRLKADGFVVASFFPDWMGDIWKHEIPSLSGKMKLMPLPAWEKGGRRTSVWGGTMLGIPKTAAKTPEQFEELWKFAKELYLSQEFTEILYRQGGIVTPVKKHWSSPLFDEPNAYFSSQPTGRLYINLAPDVPHRNSSPYNTLAMNRVADALVRLAEDARRDKVYDYASLKDRARTLLKKAHAQVADQIARNVFIAEPDAESQTHLQSSAAGGGS
ncbi:MAG TPA: extracellular solute-binding protein [Phycisphaerales bacterium]